VAPVPPGQANIAVEQAADSSRNFVLRLEDGASKRHAFVGVSFSDRAAAFDFNVAIQDHERQQRRAADMAAISAADDPLAAAASRLPEAAALYRSTGDLSLREGETIKCVCGPATVCVCLGGPGGRRGNSRRGGHACRVVRSTPWRASDAGWHCKPGI
jgi:hypothetical protein